MKDYRPPPKANGLSIYQNGGLEKNPRLASTIYKCQTCTKGFVSQEILENHMKIHAETTSVTQSVSKANRYKKANEIQLSLGLALCMGLW